MRPVKALVKPTRGPGLELRDVPTPSPSSGEALVRVMRTGICGTDLHIRSWDNWAAATVRAPLVVGHEIAGMVCAVGDGVESVDVGDLVSVEGHIVCGRCRNCRAGRRQLCADTVSIGIHRDGGFAEYVTVPATNLWRHPAGMDLDVAALFDPFGNAVHAALSFPVLGEDVLVTGAGPIGIMAAAVARHAGARHVVISDVSDYRLELARTLGIATTIRADEEPVSAPFDDLGMKEGYDVGLEMSGAPNALHSMLESMAHGGRVALLGLPSGRAGRMDFDWVRVITSMITIKGIYGREMFETWYAMTVLVEAGLDIKPVITHRFPYTDYETAFNTAETGRCGKVILDWTEG